MSDHHHPHYRYSGSSVIVVPGQILATSASEGEGGFLRGHGTYIETVHDYDAANSNISGGRKSKTAMITMENVYEGTAGGGGAKHDQEDEDEATTEQEALSSSSPPQRLIASVAGTIERVNKLISVIPTSPSLYVGHVGDLIIGRITTVGTNRWRVHLGSAQKEGQLPLSGITLPGGVQRIRTAQDAREMRAFYREGDLVSAEVQNAQHQDGTLILHTRSLRYGKLENGCLVCVPPALIRRMQAHFVTLKDVDVDAEEQEQEVGVDVLLGCNGHVWIQRSIPKQWMEELDPSGAGNDNVEYDPFKKDANKASATTSSTAPSTMLAETLQKVKQRHATTPVLPDERQTIARVRNCIECLSMVYCLITPENIMKVYRSSLQRDSGGGNTLNEAVRVADMLQPDMVIGLTACTRS